MKLKSKNLKAFTKQTLNNIRIDKYVDCSFEKFSVDESNHENYIIEKTYKKITEKKENKFMLF